jgi:RimJ/RimL family protein N-acetyltransferase
VTGTPPYRIETERLLLRCWDPADAALLDDAVAASVAELQPWMAWAHDEPLALDARIARLREFRSKFDSDQEWIYGIFNSDGSSVLGGTGLHPDVGGDALEIGYWIRSNATGAGLGGEAAAAMTRTGFRLHRVGRLEIRVAPGNTRSARIPERLGYTMEGRLRRLLPPAAPGGGREDALVYTMLAEEFDASPAAAVPIRAFDAAGRPLDAG